MTKCVKPRGALDAGDAPDLIRPYSNTLLARRPLITWRSVRGATSYSVEVKGKGVRFYQKITGTTFPYPKEQPDMHLGSAYQIVTVAYIDNRPFSATQSAVNLLPDPQVQEINQTRQTLERLNIDPDEMAYLDLDSLYMGHDLLDEGIATLELRVKAGSDNPAVFRTLGDRYLEAGLVNEAGRQYKKAISLAQKAENPQELSLAQAGWAKVHSQLQIPTSTQPAQ